jgi:hypothetical protein
MYSIKYVRDVNGSRNIVLLGSCVSQDLAMQVATDGICDPLYLMESQIAVIFWVLCCISIILR